MWKLIKNTASYYTYVVVAKLHLARDEIHAIQPVLSEPPPSRGTTGPPHTDKNNKYRCTQSGLSTRSPHSAADGDEKRCCEARTQTYGDGDGSCCARLRQATTSCSFRSPRASVYKHRRADAERDRIVGATSVPFHASQLGGGGGSQLN
ncbi:hypothetical protein MRX96_033645 [Rhipicephalus microplus]